MMGFRFDRENGFYGRRHFSFDFDEFLFGFFVLVVMVLIVTVAWRIGLFR